ncbi:nucleotide exchange factor SIL1 isoform X1 [Rhinatrema bivittatum]|uniref:nucleotide exchange factor SIL1 isoform X1 n=1 Tax=Rhinatrema bivittatum TaxID=194408 RepID=UPI0011286599|nr:nucleotide exchange factor SIL1 isoform X1 [Rhinatrema bivittatum]
MNCLAYLASSALRWNLILLLSAFLFCSCLSEQTPEFALTEVKEKKMHETENEEVTVEDELDPEDQEAFYPTREWQTVKPGQAVPAGLHMRLNLQTGKNEARIPDPENEKNGMKYKKKDKRLGKVNVDSNLYTPQELKKALAKFKEGVTESTEEEKAKLEGIKQKFRPIDELKKEFEELNMQIETDFEIMTKLISKFNSSNSSLDEKAAALNDLEYYVHQVDNAQNMLCVGGLQLVINELNGTEAVLKELSAFVLGSALSSNPKVQVEAIEGGALQKLLMILGTEQPLSLKKKALFALSSMLRHFPYAQQQFLKHGGLQILRSFFREKGAEVLCIRVVTLLYDMIVEKALLHDFEGNSEQMKEKIEQYEQINLVPVIMEQGWCTIISDLLGMPEHDTREKVLKTVHLLMASCRDQYREDQKLNSTLNILRREYEELVSEEQKSGENDSYFRELLINVNEILQNLR